VLLYGRGVTTEYYGMVGVYVPTECYSIVGVYLPSVIAWLGCTHWVTVLHVGKAQLQG